MTDRRPLALAAALLLAACGDGTTTDPGLPPITECRPEGRDAPADVYCTGLYATRDPQYHVPEALEYTPGLRLWSDGAEKRRFLLLPEGTTIDTHELDHWVFPVGTKAFKEFRVGGKLVETRLLWKQAEDRWVTTTYIWDDAELAAARNTSVVGVFLEDGYEIPTDKDCGKCHHGGSDYLLGVEAIALALPGARGHTLTDFVADGLLSDPPVDTTLSLPEDDSGHAAEALGFLHANCGMPCHSTRGLGDETQLVMRLRADELWDDTGHRRSITVPDLDTYLATVDVSPTTATVAQEWPDALRVTPGDHEQSLVWLLSNLRGDYQMPPLASHVIDDVDNAELAAWIDGL
ncbi:MAG: hypothetical protein KC621_00630 [Myxococcales bacterium]|nr:hypothetical protein [Myxococcales bacterium]